MQLIVGSDYDALRRGLDEATTCFPFRRLAPWLPPFAVGCARDRS
jgi:hypothetical protein